MVLDRRATKCDAVVESLAAAALSQSFHLPAFHSTPSTRTRLEELHLHASPALDLERLAATAQAANLARWLTALPPNVLDAAGYRRALAGLARDTGLTLQWFGEGALRTLGAGAFLAVAAGNAIRDAGIAGWERMPADQEFAVGLQAGIVALDGEREMPFDANDRVRITVRSNAFSTVDVARCMQIAACEGLFRFTSQTDQT